MPKQAQPSHSEAEHHEHAHHDAAGIETPIEAEGENFGEVKTDDMVATAATVVVVGVGAALLSAELLPGMILGVAAMMLPGVGKHMRPMLKSTVKAGYSAMRKTREMMAEASEQVQDMLAEARSEDVPPVPPPPAAAANGAKAHA
jgi:hypothetical protein